MVMMMMIRLEIRVEIEYVQNSNLKCALRRDTRPTTFMCFSIMYVQF